MFDRLASRSAPIAVALSLVFSPLAAWAQQDLETVARETLPSILFPEADIEAIETREQGADSLSVTYSDVTTAADELTGETIHVKSLSMRLETLDNNLVRISKVQLAGPITQMKGETVTSRITVDIRQIECDFLLTQESCENMLVELPSLRFEDLEEGVEITLSDLLFDVETQVASDGSYEAPFSASLSGFSLSEQGAQSFTMDSLTVEALSTGESYEDYLASAKKINELSKDEDISEDSGNAILESFLASFDKMDMTLSATGLNVLAFGPPMGIGDLNFSLDLSHAGDQLIDLTVGLSHLLPAERTMLAALAGLPPEMLPDEAQVSIDLTRLPTEAGNLMQGMDELGGEDLEGDRYLEAMAEAGTEINVSGTQIKGPDYLGTLTGGVVAGAKGFFGQVIGEVWGLDALMAMVSNLPPEQQQQAMQALGMLTFMGRPEDDGTGEQRLIYDIAFEKSGAILVNDQVMKPATPD